MSGTAILLAAYAFITFTCVYGAYRAGVVNERAAPGDSATDAWTRSDKIALVKMAALTLILIVVGAMTFARGANIEGF